MDALGSDAGGDEPLTRALALCGDDVGGIRVTHPETSCELARRAWTPAIRFRQWAAQRRCPEWKVVAMRNLRRSLGILQISLIAFGALSLVWPERADAATVVYNPSQARPGTTITISGPVCGLYQDNDFVLFSDRFAPQLPDGITDLPRADASAVLTPVGGELTEHGIFTNLQTFVVPKLPAGDYFLYGSCNDASACCVPLEPTFRVLGAPNTSTEEALQTETGPPWLVLGVVFAVAFAMIMRFRSINPRRGPSGDFGLPAFVVRASQRERRTPKSRLVATIPASAAKTSPQPADVRECGSGAVSVDGTVAGGRSVGSAAPTRELARKQP